ncbi:uncharacterized protein DEA37_0006568 [Paragonimus westermani]|uniref:Uncharacterized protein n=1 Tax=Paragonimus westermani TaxID=34504 RepID=A0A5J4N8Z2_9TREM|nr:uncharacterized protein DEA37_0006568 [Paragonimus westermani]
MVFNPLQNSGGGSDITTPNSPLRGPQRSACQDSVSSVTAASGSKSTAHHAPRDLVVPHATVVRAPTTDAQLTGTAEIVSSNVAASHRLGGSRATSQSTCSNKTSIPTADYGLTMTVSELRSVAERQRQQLTRQAQQLQTKEERLAWLRSARSRASGDGSSGVDKLPVPGCELSHDQEMRLHKLRSFRGQTEQTRLTNEHIAREIDNLARLLSSKELELETLRKRMEDTQRLLSLIGMCQACLTNSSKTRTHRSQAAKNTEVIDGVDLEKPLDLLSVQLPFSTERVCHLSPLVTQPYEI